MSNAFDEVLMPKKKVRKMLPRNPWVIPVQEPPLTHHQQRQAKKVTRKVKRECTNKQILSQLRRSLQTPEQKRTRRMLLRIQTGKINGMAQS